MAHFYGTLQGNRGEASRLGSKASGVRATVESWSTILRVAQFNRTDSDRVRIDLSTKHGNYLLSASIDAERVAKHAGSDPGVDAAIAKVEQAFDALNEAVRDAELDQLAADAEDALTEAAEVL